MIILGPDNNTSNDTIINSIHVQWSSRRAITQCDSVVRKVQWIVMSVVYPETRHQGAGPAPIAWL